MMMSLLMLGGEGVVVTVGILGVGSYFSFVKGNSRMSQLMQRARYVVVQGRRGSASCAVAVALTPH